MCVKNLHGGQISIIIIAILVIPTDYVDAYEAGNK